MQQDTGTAIILCAHVYKQDRKWEIRLTPMWNHLAMFYFRPLSTCVSLTSCCQLLPSFLRSICLISHTNSGHTLSSSPRNAILQGVSVMLSSIEWKAEWKHVVHNSFQGAAPIWAGRKRKEVGHSWCWAISALQFILWVLKLLHMVTEFCENVCLEGRNELLRIVCMCELRRMLKALSKG